MFGAIIVFAAVLAIVFTYMSIVHSFLRSAEEPEDEAREAQYRMRNKPAPDRPHAGRPQYAH